MYRLIVLLALMMCSAIARAQTNVVLYDIPVNKAAIQPQISHAIDSLLSVHPQLSNKVVYSSIINERTYDDKTPDFYLLLILIAILGLIRAIDPKYFNNMWHSFISPSRVSRQLREQMSGPSLPSILMNVFFAISVGAYAYYLVKMYVPYDSHRIPRYLLIMMLIGGLACIYLTKYAMVKFSGWAFKVQGITEQYIFNILLINKIAAISLIPFTLMMAFGGPNWQEPAAMFSCALVALLLINRYTRSWQVFGSFFQYSRFHFFTYLCASELLPLAVLIKLLIRGLAWS
jgi:hypothetical protein